MKFEMGAIRSGFLRAEAVLKVVMVNNSSKHSKIQFSGDRLLSFILGLDSAEAKKLAAARFSPIVHCPHGLADIACFPLVRA